MSSVVSNFKKIFVRFKKKENDDRIYVGVDWMKGKWIAVELAGNVASYKTFDCVGELCDYYKGITEILIDMPVGLPENKHEEVNRPDSEARRYLKVTARKSSVFPVAYRQFVYAESREELESLYNKFGRRQSRQSESIMPCIRQVDMFLQNNAQWRERLVESHPECAFQALNEGKGIEFSKHTAEGIEERIKILSKYASNVRELALSVSKDKREDVLDSLCLAVTSKLGYVPISKIAYDSKGLPMRIVVPKL